MHTKKLTILNKRIFFILILVPVVTLYCDHGYSQDYAQLKPFDRGRTYKSPKVPLRDQNDPKNGIAGEAACGPTCLGMAFEHFGKDIPTSQLIKELQLDPESGATIKQLTDLANAYFPNSHFPWGIAFGKNPMNYLEKNINDGALAIIPISGNYAGRKAVPEGHYILVTGMDKNKVYANDPSGGKHVSIERQQFKETWGTKDYSGVIIKK